jgi:hypothetical protein
MKFTNASLYLIALFTVFLSACDGGKSKSGGSQEKNVTSCIVIEEQENNLGLTEKVYRNTCSFAVNFGYGLVSVSTITILEQDAIYTSVLPGGYIACRPPSQPYDRDDTAARDFACTD